MCVCVCARARASACARNTSLTIRAVYVRERMHVTCMSGSVPVFLRVNVCSQIFICVSLPDRQADRQRERERSVSVQLVVGKLLHFARASLKT